MQKQREFDNEMQDGRRAAEHRFATYTQFIVCLLVACSNLNVQADNTNSKLNYFARFCFP